MKEKCWFAAAACNKAKILLASAVKNHYISAITLLLAVGASVQFAGVELFQPVFAEQSLTAIPDPSSVQAPSGNSYYRSMSESLSVVASYGSGSGSSSPQSYYRSVSESMSLTTVQGKAPNSYSRSISEQASLTTGMPLSAPAAGQSTRAAPTPYSASSNQRIDERVSFRNTSGGKADLTYRNNAVGTPVYSTDSVMLTYQLSGSSAGMIIQDTASIDGDTEDAADDSSAFLRQLDPFNEHMLMQKSIENAAVANLSTSAVILLGTVTIIIAKQPAVSSGRLQKKMYAFFLLKAADDGNATAKKIVNTQVTYVLLVVLVIFTVSSIVNAVDPLAGQAFAAITYVDAGMAVTGSGDGDLIPSLPSGLQTDDMMVVYYYTRGTGGSVSISAGWTQLYDHSDSGGRIAVWYRFYQNGDGAPTVTSSGLISSGNPNGRDDTIAQVAAWRGASIGNPIDAQGTVSTNASQQNIGAITGITIAADSVVIVVGGKRDDWTSVATLSGDSLTWTEIGEPDSTAGADAGMVWDYAINGALQKTITSKTFTVTGGTNAAGKGVMFSVKVPQNLQANLSEQMAATDQIVRTIISSRAVSEQLTTTETIAVSVSKLLTEQFGMTDSLQRSTITARTLSEQLAVTESVSKAFAAVLSEQMAFAEQLVRTIASTRSMSDQFALTESASKTVSYILSENLAITESVSRTAAVTIPIAEQLGLSDTATKAVSKSLIEQVGLTDDLQRSTITIRTMTEQLGPTDTISIAISKSPSEQLGIIDILQRSIVTTRTTSEQLTITDAITKAVSYALNEQLTVQDTPDRSISSSRSATEVLAVQDMISKVVSTILAEQIAITDQTARAVTQSRSASEQLDITDTLAVSVKKPLADSLGMSDATARSVTQSRSMTEQLAVQETLSQAIAKALFEQLSVTDAITRTPAVSRAMTEQLMMTDAMSTASSKSLTEQLGITDNIQRSIATIRTLSEQMAVTETTTKVVSTTLSEQLTMIETFARIVTQSRSIAEQVAVADIVSTNVGRIMTEQLGTSDTLYRSVVNNRSLSEQITLTESITKSVSTALNEQLVMTETVAKSAIQSGSVTEQFAVQDTISVATAKMLSEQLAVTDNLQRSVANIRTPSEQMAVTDTISKSIPMTISEQLTMTESATRSSTSSRSLSEQLTVQDTITKAVARAMIEQLGIQDALARSAVVAGAMSEQLSLTDLISISTSKSTSEQLSIQDTVGRSVAVAASPSDQLGLTETVTRAVSKSMSESLGMSDSLTRSAVQSDSMSEQLTIAEFIATSVTKSVSEQMGMAESTNRSTVLSRTTSEQLVMTDAFEAQISNVIVEQLTTQDTISVSTAVSRSVTDSMSLAESVAASPTKSVSEQLIVSDIIAIEIAIPIAEQIGVSDSITAITSGPVFATDQIDVTESVSIIVSKQLADSLALTDASMISGSTTMADSVAMTDTIARSVIVARAVSENLALSDTTSSAPAVLVIIAESMSIDDSFADIALLVNLNLGEPLVIVQSFATDFAASLDQADSEGIIIADSVVLSLTGPVSRSMTESMGIEDSLIILVMIPPPPPPPAIATMPNLMMAETENLEGFDSLTDPMEAISVNGTWAIPSLNSQGLEWILQNTIMPTYDVDLEAASGGIDDMTMILPTFQVWMENEWSDDGAFLTPTLSNLPAGMQVMIPINVETSMAGVGNLDALGNMTVSFTPAESASDFAMLIALLDNNPEDIADESPKDIPAFYIDISIVGNFTGATPSDETFFEEPPQIRFTVTDEWAQEQSVERDSNNVPIIGLLLLDEGSGEWNELADEVESPTSAVDDIYTYSATVPHFSTYAVTASASDDSGQGSNRDRAFTRLLSESLFVSSVANLSVPAGSEGKIVIKDITESLTLRTVQPQPLHQRVITVHNVSVAVNVADVKPAAAFGTAVATLNFEIMNKNSAEEELLLRYWYSDPVSGEILYEGKQAVTVGAGQSLIQTVDVPFYSEGIFDLIIEVESDDGTLATTDIAVSVPWLAVYLYVLVSIAIAMVLISIFYVIFAIRRSSSFNTSIGS